MSLKSRQLSRKMTQCLSLISDPFRINCKKLRTLNMDWAVCIGETFNFES